MFWKRNDKDQKGAKLSGPRDIPEIVKKHLAANPIIDAGIVPYLKAVVKMSENGAKRTNIIIFDPSDAEAREVKVQNYDILEQNPGMIIAEGWFDETAKKVEMTPRQAISKIKYYTHDEILQQIQGLKEPGSSVFFYTNAGAGAGGPLGRGAALVRVNAPVDGKKVKKYSVFGVNIVDMQPTSKENKIFESDKPIEISKWIVNSHKARFC
ncbi:MAG: hypothetical protein JXA46_04935 [Dehalococcoidales bacterium]|nr:hypothetical protein [Dehalococcoidales bacterium]